ncbi:MAG: radical SAM family heme chaperone HemW [Verrucomicrobiales bacterium]|nr:radical SAM family heme chaperone HemW [Verrucomicrobiales bacterium]
MARHLYLHIPFCHRVCPYCSFHKHLPGNTDLSAFTDALLRELDLRRLALRPETIYFGGGTPTFLSEIHLRRLLEGLTQRLDLSALREWTVEANPRTVLPIKADLLRAAGVTRISLGVQAWDEPTLRTLGRDHHPDDAEETFHILRRAGFASLNLDLMFSIPGQSLETWQQTLHRTLALQPDHISAYNLNYEEDTEFFERLQRGQYRELPEQDARFFDSTLDLLGAAGYRCYEISNHALPGHESIHNAAYWCGADYLGLGPGATSTVAGRRWQNARDTAHYMHRIANGELPETDIEHLTAEQRRTERFGLELRTARGLPAHLVDEPQQALLKQLARDGLLRVEDGFIRLTREGQPLADSIAVALLD